MAGNAVGFGVLTAAAFSGVTSSLVAGVDALLAEAATRGQPDPQLGIAGQGNAGEAHLPAGQPLGHGESRGLVALAGADHGDPVPAQGEAVDDAAERHGDAVDFRSVSFGNEGEVQRVLPGGGRRTGQRAQACYRAQVKFPWRLRHNWATSAPPA